MTYYLPSRTEGAGGGGGLANHAHPSKVQGARFLESAAANGINLLRGVNNSIASHVAYSPLCKLRSTYLLMISTQNYHLTIDKIFGQDKVNGTRCNRTLPASGYS